MQLNLSQARDLLWEFSMAVPLASATTAEKATFRSRLNLACGRLLTMGKWRGTRLRAQLPVYDGNITLPRYLESALGVSQCSCCLNPRQIWGIYAPFQVALNECWTNGVIAVSETAQTFIVPDEGFKLKVVSLAGDNGKFVNFINGTNTSDAPIYATETLTLNAASPPTSATTWNTLPTIQKDATTKGVELYSVIGATEELIAIYAPAETIPAYKRYSVGNSSELTSVDALCKLAFVAAMDDTDLIFPSVIGALSKGLQAVQYELKSDDRANGLWADALKILNDDRAELDGKHIPIIETIGSFGAGDVPNLTGDCFGYPGYPAYGN